MGYVTGAISKPNTNDPTDDRWDFENSLIMSWLLDSMELEISCDLLSQIPKEIWEAITKTHAQYENLAHVYDLKCRFHKVK